MDLVPLERQTARENGSGIIFALGVVQRLAEGSGKKLYFGLIRTAAFSDRIASERVSAVRWATKL